MRHTLVPILLLCVALASVGAGVLTVIRHNRAELVRQFTVDRQAQLTEATRGVTDSLEQIGEDLSFAGELLSQPGPLEEHRRELRALLEVVGQFKAIAVYDAQGTERLRLVDRRAEPRVAQGQLFPRMAELVPLALQSPPGDITSSPPLEEAGGAWLRVLATAIPQDEGGPGGVVAVLVDMESFFLPLRIVTSDSEARLLLIGAHGRPSPASDPVLADWYQRVAGDTGRMTLYASLAEKMRKGERGTLLLGEQEAARLGLGTAEAVAAFTPIPLKGGSHWSAATLVSTAALRSHERGLVLRLSLAALLVALFLVAFGVYVMVAQRRAVALRESRRHADRLAHLHDKTQKILDHIPTGVLALTAEGRVSAVNQPLRARLPPDAIGSPLASTFPQAPEPVVARLTALVEAAAGESRVRSLLGEPLTLFGEEGQYNLHVVPLEARDPEVRTLLVIEDLSNVRALETQLLRAEKLATVGVLAAGIAHEIGTPLGVVRGRAEYVLGKLGAAHPQAAGVGVIVDQIDQVSRTIRQLLDFSRLQPAVARPVALSRLLRDVYELLRLEAERRQVVLELDVPEGLPLLAADPDQLQQALVNLVLNACDACSAGGRVHLSATAPDGSSAGAWGFVTLLVRDDGCGIPAESRNQVFDPFFTTKKRGQGTGLGLAIVAQIVRNHGGRVELESEPGQGTCFTLLWPVAGPATVEERHVNPGAHPGGG
ncbi:sensor histidine kinase [Stigmatella erecta]|uniref:histidine kinase n=1 Tax=Stigmatella erecta TaxID=83460 RepID=A0A1I0KVD4_9BACT|nr:PAS domain-containing sensor histidine kinase [Stigmatella erecta]SEU29177.1 Signal transduction histidine kinase [Stigmatella erecta]